MLLLEAQIPGIDRRFGFGVKTGFRFLEQVKIRGDDRALAPEQ